MLQLARWVWETEADLPVQDRTPPHYRAPRGARHLLDLRSTPSCATPETAPGWGLFDAPALLPDALALGDAFGAALDGATRAEFAARTGVVAPMAGRTLAELLTELLTERCDPQGLDTVPPFLPSGRRVRVSIAPGLAIDQPIASGSPALARLRGDYTRLRAETEAGQHAPGTSAKYLSIALAKTGMDAAQFTPRPLTAERPLPPTTDLSAAFTGTNGDPLPAPWSTEFGTFEIQSNRAQIVGNIGHQDTRYGSDLSVDDHYAEAETWAVTTAGSGDYSQVTIRRNSGGTRSYYGFTFRRAASQTATWKMVSGTPTTIGTTTGGDTYGSGGKKIKGEATAAGNIVRSWDGTVRDTVADSSITGNVQCGLGGITSTGNIDALDNWFATDGISAGGATPMAIYRVRMHPALLAQ